MEAVVVIQVVVDQVEVKVGVSVTLEVEVDCCFLAGYEQALAVEVVLGEVAVVLEWGSVLDSELVLGQTWGLLDIQAVLGVPWVGVWVSVRED